MKKKILIGALFAAPMLFFSAILIAQGSLENPQNGSFQSGIGIFSGWYCDADVIEIVVDDRPAKQAAYGTPRRDTESVCGDTDNGFGLLFNFNLYDIGQHTVTAYADGVQFGSAQFTVENLGSSFIRGLDSWVEITIPELGKEAILIWQESMQGYVLTNVEDLDYEFEDLLNAVVGDYSGNWESAWASGGTMDMTIEVVRMVEGMTIQPTSITLNNTGCASNSAQTTPFMSIDSLTSEAVMTDGSEVEFEFVGSESLTAVGGSFVFDSGSCADLDGAFILFKQD